MSSRRSDWRRVCLRGANAGGYRLRAQRRATTWSALFGCLVALPVAAVDDDTGLWFTLNLTTGISDSVDLSLALQPRFDEDISHLDRVVIRPSVDWNVTSRTRLTQGYDAHLISAGSDRVEHRSWQQVQHNVPLTERLLGVLRVRLEQRFIEHVAGTALRGRFLAGGVYRLDGPWGLRLTNETFVNLNQPAGTRDAAFDQNRVIAGFTYRIGPGASALLGYQNQYLGRAGEDRTIHQLFLAYSQRF